MRTWSDKANDTDRKTRLVDRSVVREERTPPVAVLASSISGRACSYGSVWRSAGCVERRERAMQGKTEGGRSNDGNFFDQRVGGFHQAQAWFMRPAFGIGVFSCSFVV